MASKTTTAKSTPKTETKTETKSTRSVEVPDAVQAGEIGPSVDALHTFLESKTKFKASDEDVPSHYGPATRAAVQELQAKMSANGTWDGKVDGEISPTFIEAVRKT